MVQFQSCLSNVNVLERFVFYVSSADRMTPRYTIHILQESQMEDFFVNCSLTILMLVYIRLNVCTVYANSFTFHEWGLLKPSYNTPIPHRLISIHITLNTMSTLSRLISSHLKSSHFFFIFSATFPQQLNVAQICAFPPLRRKQCVSLPTPLLFNVLN